MGRDMGKGGRGCKSFGNPSGIELAERSREGGGVERGSPITYQHQVRYISYKLKPFQARKNAAFY